MQWRSKEEAYTLGAGFRGAPIHFAVSGLIFRKNCKNHRSVGGSASSPPLTSGGWGFALDPELLFSYIIATLKS